jgi:nucleotide-binding universal stress UspA family protein
MPENSEQKKDKRPIVCGTDFSAAAVEAVDLAAAMAKRLGTKFVLVHVDEFHGMAEVDPTLFEAALSQKRGDLDREATRLRKSGIVVEEKLLSGSPFDELVTAAIEANGRLLVVGAVGHGLPRRLLVGSVAERAAETSPIPTLVVRPGSRLGSWIRGEHPLRVLVGYDFSAAGDAALRWLNEMQGVGSCETSVVHIDWPPEEAHRVGYHGPLPLTENPEEIQNFLERDLAERVEMVLPRDKVTITVEPGWGHPEGYLFELASRQHVDLVVVGTHRRHGLGRLRFGSVSRTVLHHASVPVAVVPPAEDQERAIIPKLDRVLVATDFSDLGNKAALYGCAILRRGGTLKLIHVIAVSGAPAADKNEPRPGKGNPKLLSQLRSLVPPEASESFDIQEEIIENAEAAQAIAQEAERFRADAICLGSHGRTGLAKAFLGSVAQGVMAQSKRPVLIVRADEE